MKKHLKNFFIPHAENNYHPHILHTKRAVFYSAVFLLMKIIVVGFVILLPSAVFVFPDVLGEEEKLVYKFTNEIRDAQGLPALAIAPKLQNSAAFKASDMANKGYFSHTAPSGEGLSDWLTKSNYDYRFAGENLAMGFSDAHSVVEAWKQSPMHYANLIDKDYVQNGVAFSSGNYNGVPTVFVAGHFGTPKTKVELALIKEPAAVVVETKNTSTLVVAETPTAEILPSSTPIVVKTATSSTSETTVAVIAPKIPLTVLASSSKVFWSPNDNGGTHIWAAVDFSDAGARNVELVVAGKTFSLAAQNPTHFGGELDLGQSPTELFRVVLMPELAFTDADGLAQNTIVNWDKVLFVSPTPIEKYTHAKSVLSPLTRLFSVASAIYFWAMIFFSIALFLNIVIEIRRQHYHIIAQTLLLLALLFALWKF